jgi:excisionase family DNA binding protein
MKQQEKNGSRESPAIAKFQAHDHQSQNAREGLLRARSFQTWPEASGPDLMTMSEAALYLGCSLRTINNLIDSGDLPRRKLGWHVRLGREQIDAAMDKNRVDSFVCSRRAQRDGSAARRKWMTRKQVAHHLRCSLRTVSKLMNSRNLAFSKLNRLVRVEFNDLNAMMVAYCATREAGKLIPQSTEPAHNQDLSWVTKSEAASILNLKPGAIDTLLRRRLLSVSRIGRLVRLSAAELPMLGVGIASDSPY